MHRVHPEVSVFTDLPAVPDSAEAVLLKTSSAIQKKSLGFIGAFSPDVDYTVNCVRAPKSSARASNDLNLLDIGQECLLHIPEHTGEKRGVQAPAVHQHLHFIRHTPVESASRHCPGVTIDLRHVHLRA